MLHLARFSCFAVLVFATAIRAQSVISAHSGTIHYVEGKVLLNNQEISPKFGEFPAMENGAVLRTTDQGRVEVLLTPGVILRIGEGSSIRMMANTLADTRVELQAGKAVLECAEILKGDAITLVVAGKSVSFAKNGVYEATAEPAVVQVYKGEAAVVVEGKPLMVKRGHEVLLGSAVTAEKFSDSATDDLYNWSSRRSGYLALANVAAANAVNSGYGGYGYGFMGGGWAWNPGFGMFTMLPSSGMMWSPFGYGFYSPYSLYDSYYPYYYGSSNGSSNSGMPSGSSAYNGRPISQTGTSSARSVSTGHMGEGGRAGSVSSGGAGRGH